MKETKANILTFKIECVWINYFWWKNNKNYIIIFIKVIRISKTSNRFIVTNKTPQDAKQKYNKNQRLTPITGR